jgi:hypothetical protein
MPSGRDPELPCTAMGAAGRSNMRNAPPRERAAQRSTPPLPRERRGGPQMTPRGDFIVELLWASWYSPSDSLAYSRACHWRPARPSELGPIEYELKNYPRRSVGFCLMIWSFAPVRGFCLPFAARRHRAHRRSDPHPAGRDSRSPGRQGYPGKARSGILPAARGEAERRTAAGARGKSPDTLSFSRVYRAVPAATDGRCRPPCSPEITATQHGGHCQIKAMLSSQ